MRVRVKFLASSREIAGTREETLEFEGPATVIDILKLLAQKHGSKLRDYLFDPETETPRPRLQFLLNGKSIHMMHGFDTLLGDSSDLMIFPPVGGG